MKDICKLFYHDLSSGDLKIHDDLYYLLNGSIKNKIWITSSPTRKCLLMFSIDDWINLEEHLSTLTFVGQDQCEYVRKLIGHSHLIDLNDNKTVILPENLLDNMGMNDMHTDVFILACNDNIEIWRTLDLYDYLSLDTRNKKYEHFAEIKKRLEFYHPSLRLLLNINGVKI